VAIWRQVLTAGAVLLALQMAHAQQPAPATPRPAAPVINVQALGPQVGRRIPAFTLADQNGTPRTLRSLMGPNGLMLVLYRSADW